MEHKLLGWKAAITLAISAIADFLGWKGVLLIAWFAAMALDYLSGTFAALRAGEWSSNVARDGLLHKGGMIFVIAICAIADMVMAVACANMELGIQWPGLVFPLALTWYFVTESGSVLENAVKMGANVPTWLVKLLKASANAIEKTGELQISDKNDK